MRLNLRAKENLGAKSIVPRVRAEDNKCTLKQRALKLELEKELKLNPTLKDVSFKEIAHRAGYSLKATSYHKERTKEMIKDVLAKYDFTKESVKAIDKVILGLAIDKEDFSNAMRANEHISKIGGFEAPQKQEISHSIKDITKDLYSEVLKHRSETTTSCKVEPIDTVASCVPSTSLDKDSVQVDEQEEVIENEGNE